MVLTEAAIVLGAGVVALKAAPVTLWLAGFGSGGVVAGSLAAVVQGPATVAGSLFALCQSAGVLGLAAVTKAVIFGTASTVAGALTWLFT